jgi:glucokinase
MTNHPWSITEAQLSNRTGGGLARLINDFAALAYAAPALSGTDLQPLGPPLDIGGAGTIAVMGAGTGFGVAALVRDGDREAALVSEGGHAAFAPQDRMEVEIQRFLALRYGRVSIERVLSGPGLLNLHQAISHIEGRPAAYLTPDAVTAAAAAGEPTAIACTERFCGILGAVAGDFALAYGARGGVQIAGGVSQKLLTMPAADAFRARFEDKGRFTPYVAAIPTLLVMHPHAALLGAARALRTGFPKPS